MEKPESLIGRKIKGFKFEDIPGVLYHTEKMNQYIGKPGKIDVYFDIIESFAVKFDDRAFIYPAAEIEQHLIPEETNSPNKALSPEEVFKKYAKMNWAWEYVEIAGCVNITDGVLAMQEYHSQQSWADQKERVELKRQIEDLNEVLEDKRRITKEIDVIINGNDAAQQPALIDVQKSVELLVRNLAAEKEKSAKLAEVFKKAVNHIERVAYLYDTPENKVQYIMKPYLEALKDYEQK